MLIMSNALFVWPRSSLRGMRGSKNISINDCYVRVWVEKLVEKIRFWRIVARRIHINYIGAALRGLRALRGERTNAGMAEPVAQS